MKVRCADCNLHTGRSLTDSTIADAVLTQIDLLMTSTVPSQPAHRTVTYREYYARCCINTIRPPDDEYSVARNM